MDTSPGTRPGTRGTVVVGVDGSASADLALDWAARQATLEHRDLTIVHACDPLYAIWIGSPALDRDALRSSTNEYARTTMRAAVDRVRSDHPDLVVHEALSETDPRQELIDCSYTAAMVVVGSRGRGPVRTLLLGSVSTAVSSHAVCPVVVIRPDAGGEPRERAGVLVGVQGAAVSRPVLEHAFHLASTRELPLTVLQCFWAARLDGPGTSHTDPDGAGPDAWSADRDLLDAMVTATSAKFPDVEVTVSHQHGYLDRLLVDLSPTMDAVVLGSHHPTLLRRAVYGSLARTVLEHASGAVVVVPVHLDDPAGAHRPD